MELIRKVRTIERAEKMLRIAGQMKIAASYALNQRKWYVVTFEGGKNHLDMLLHAFRVTFKK